MPDWASANAVPVATEYVPLALDDVVPPTEAGVPFTVKDPPVGRVVSIRTIVVTTGAVSPRPFLPVRVYRMHPEVIPDSGGAPRTTAATKLEQDPANPRHLVTVRGVGYRLDVNP